MTGTSELSRLKVLVPLRAESRAMGVASALISAVTLVAALARPDSRPLAVVVVFVITAATWLLVMQLLVVRGMRRKADGRGPDACRGRDRVEQSNAPPRARVRAALAAIAAVQLGSGATFAGMLAGAAVPMMLQARWLARREQETRERLLRERRFWTGGWWPNYFRTPAS